MCFSLLALWLVSASSSAPASSYSSQLRRYPYLTDVIGSYATINWATDRSESSGAVRYGKAGSESCTAHYVPATKIAITVNGVLQYQWKAQLDLEPGTQYCYRVYLGTSPINAIDLLGSDPAPTFWTQVPSGGDDSFSFVVFGDWGYVGPDGTNSYQANLMSLIASSGARFAITTGDNGYPSGSQKNFGDLIQTGPDISAIFGPSFWKVPGSSMPIFPALGNHGFNSADSNHPALITWPQDRAVALSGGRSVKETYCCINGSLSKAYPSLWYAFDAGPARFYVLHTAWEEVNIGTASEYQMDYDYHMAPGSPQYEWLKADLEAHPSVLKLAFFHYPLYSDNPHEATDTFLLGPNSLEGLLKQNGVDLAFTGHAHIYERNFASQDGIPNYLTGGGGATPGTLGTCTPLDAYAIKFTTSGKACGSAPVPTSVDEIYHFLKVTVNGTSVTVTPINSLGQTFDVQNYSFSTGSESSAPTVPAGLNASAVSGTQIDLSWSASMDDTGVRGYGIYRNGTLVDTVDYNTLAYSDTNLPPSTTYSYRVDAFDGSGNHSALSTSKSATTQNTATYTFAPVADAYVAADLPATNYGRSSSLRADGSPDYHSYLRFHVGEIGGTVTSATLRLYATSSSATGYQIKSVSDQSWEEGTIIYDNAPAVGTLIGSSGRFSAGNWTTIDVTSLVTGNGVYDLALTTTSNSVMNFNSQDATANQPQLVIQTSTGGATATPSSTPTTTSTPTSTATFTPTYTPTFTPTATLGIPVNTFTPTYTPTFTATSTATSSSTPSATATIAGNTVTFTAAADARVHQSAPTKNYGSVTSLQADSDPPEMSYIRFTVSGLSGPIQNVKLRVYCSTNGTKNGPAAYLADNNWIERGTGGITWDTKPALLSGAFDNKGAIPTNSWVEYNVTALVTGNGTYTFALVADNTDGVTFSSREGGTPPQLVIETQSTVTPTLGFTATSTSTGTATSAPTATQTSTPTATQTLVATSTSTRTPTATLPPTQTFTATHTSTATSAPTATNVDTETPTATNTELPVDTPTHTETPTPTDAQPPTSTATITFGGPTDTATFTPTSSEPATETPTPVNTEPSTPTSTSTALPSSTSTQTPTATSVPADAATNTATATATTAANTITFTVLADARVSQASPTTNLGSQTNLQADATAGVAQGSFIRFNLSGISGQIQSVKLRVYCTTNATNNGPAVHLADNNWIEKGIGGVTWDTQPALSSEAADNKGAIALASWVEYDVTVLVTGDGTYTFALIADGNDGVTFSSREGTTPPQLVVTFQQ